MKNKVEIQLVAMIDRIRAERNLKYCADDLGLCNLCNLCGGSLDNERFMIDEEVKYTPQMILPDVTRIGQWAYTCCNCFSKRGVGIRYVLGQLYERIGHGKWL